jgi:hypothetical protein
MMEAASTSEMLVNFYHTTQRNIPEDGYICSLRIFFPNEISILLMMVMMTVTVV